MLVPINVTGGDYQHKSRPLSSQMTRNFWPQIQPTQKGRSPYILQSFYGLKSFKTQSGGADRGMRFNQDVLYKVSGSTLYTVASDGTHTSRGTIDGAGRCILSALGSNMIIVTGGKAYQWNGSALAEIVDSNLANPNGAASINNQMIYDEGTGQIFWVSDVGDATTLNGLNYASAESTPGALKIPYGYREVLYLMKDDAIELWWNSGQGNPPFDKIQGAVINVGLGAIYSVADNPDFMFFFGSDRQVHTLTGSSAAVDTVISPPELNATFQNYETVSDAIGWTMQLEGQWFYSLTFPSEDITWVYPVGGEWFTWGSGLTGRSLANSYAKAFGKHLVGDYASANIYELDANTYTDNGETIIRTRDTAPIHGGLFKLDGKTLEMSRFELFLETGIGLVTGQGSDPIVMLSYSDDGGRNFSNERMAKVGTAGDFKKRAVWTNLGRFQERILRFRVSDPIYWALYSGVAEIEACI